MAHWHLFGWVEIGTLPDKTLVNLSLLQLGNIHKRWHTNEGVTQRHMLYYKGEGAKIGVPSLMNDPGSISSVKFCNCNESPRVVYVLVLGGAGTHSQCSLKEIPKFFKKFRLQNNTLKSDFLLIISFNVCYCKLSFILKIKNNFM